MNNTILVIAQTDDVTIIRAAEHFHTEASKALRNEKISIQDLNELLNTNDAFKNIVDLAEKKGEKELNVADSIEMARLIFVTAAQDSELATFIGHCLRNYPDDRQSVGKTMSVGLLTALLLIIATTEIEYTNGPIKVHKKSFIPQHVIATIPQIKTKIEANFIESDTAPFDK